MADDLRGVPPSSILRKTGGSSRSGRIEKSYTTVLASDRGGNMGPDPDPPGDWARHSNRQVDLIYN